MGSPKALVEVDGVLMIERVASALAAAGCTPILVVGIPPGVEPDQFEAIITERGWRLVPDRWPGDGPLGGVSTALAEVAGDVVVVACDLPDLDEATVRALLAPSRSQVDVVQATTDRPQPLLCRWAPSARPVLEALRASGERRVHAALADLRVDLRPVSPDALRNVNTPADLEQRAQSRRPPPSAGGSER